jgi:hypothetical protein
VADFVEAHGCKLESFGKLNLRKGDFLVVKIDSSGMTKEQYRNFVEDYRNYLQEQLGDKIKILIITTEVDIVGTLQFDGALGLNFLSKVL